MRPASNARVHYAHDKLLILCFVHRIYMRVCIVIYVEPHRHSYMRRNFSYYSTVAGAGAGRAHTDKEACARAHVHALSILCRCIPDILL